MLDHIYTPAMHISRWSNSPPPTREASKGASYGSNRARLTLEEGEVEACFRGDRDLTRWRRREGVSVGGGRTERWHRHHDEMETIFRNYGDGRAMK